MKCPSCKYENRYHLIYVDDVIRYKSGKNKGEIKEVKKKYIEFNKDDPEFVQLNTDQGDCFFFHSSSFSKENASLYACPMCGTVIVQEINEGMANV